MSTKLDPTGQRIVGVLLEKELSVPGIYPLSENALVDGCNQRSNREPVVGLEAFQVHGAVLQLLQDEWVARVEGSGRVTKYRHRIEDRFQLDGKQKAVLAELLLRGPQAPGALKARVARMGFHGTPEEVEALLRGMAGRPDPLVRQLPLGPRERDQRWCHLLGLAAVPEVTGAAPPDDAAPPRRVAPVPAPPPAPAPREAPGPDLAARVRALEQEVAALRARLDAVDPAGSSG